ncbi:hypothetical protein [Flavobacterium sp. LAR06]|uniref:hypothetical protein n=1 Tax=Flavobacterium sp. LAR06 TaxID=3064897 RepID=UPI0035C1DA2B
MIKRILLYLILLILYVFLPGITQQIFMNYDDSFFYIMATELLILNALLAFTFLKLANKLLNIIAAAVVTSLGVLSVTITTNLNLGWETISISLFANAISSILCWEAIFQLKEREKQKLVK